MLSAAGVLPRPGICMTSPHSGDEPAGARVRADVADRQGEVLGRVQQRRVGRQREVRLRHADREVAETLAGELGELRLGRGVEVDVLGPVDLLGHGLDLVLDRLVVLIDLVEGVRLLGRLDDRRGEVGDAGAALRRSPRWPRPRTRRPASASRLTSSISSLVSPGRRLTATTAGSAERRGSSSDGGGRSRSRSRSPAAPPSVGRGSSSSPPWCLIARTVATSTTADGVSLPTRQTMSKNFSMPMSAPKPDSVTT